MNEYDKAYSTYQTQITTIIQLVSAFVTLNATVLGIGLSIQKTWLFIVGACISGITALIISRGEMATRVFLTRCIEIESTQDEGKHSITSSWAAFLYGPGFPEKFLEASKHKSQKDRIQALMEIKSRVNSSKFVLMIYLAILVQIALSVALLFLGSTFL